MSPVYGILAGLGACLLWIAFHEDSPAFHAFERLGQRLAAWFYGL